MDGLDLFQQEQWRSLGLHDALYSLRPNEQLQVHMDCMNAVGEIVSIEDVDDMGGSVGPVFASWFKLLPGSLFPCSCVCVTGSAGHTSVWRCTEWPWVPTVRTRLLSQSVTPSCSPRTAACSASTRPRRCPHPRRMAVVRTSIACCCKETAAASPIPCPTTAA